MSPGVRNIALAAAVALAAGCGDTRRPGDPLQSGDPPAQESLLQVVFQSLPEGLEFLVLGDVPTAPGTRIRLRDGRGAILSERPPAESGTLLKAPRGSERPFVVEAATGERIVASVTLDP